MLLQSKSFAFPLTFFNQHLVEVFLETLKNNYCGSISVFSVGLRK